MRDSHLGLRVGGTWLAVASVLLAGVLVFHGPLAPHPEEQMRVIAASATRWGVVHWVAAVALSLFAVAGLVVLTAGSRLTSNTYRTKLESRPHRAALSSGAAAHEIHCLAKQGKLDSHCTRAVVVAAGHAQPRPSMEAPAGLTGREVEVLRLVARGLSNRQIAQALAVTPKTAGHHVQHIYDKLGVSTRVGATLFAVRHGLAGHVE